MVLKKIFQLREYIWFDSGGFYISIVFSRLMISNTIQSMLNECCKKSFLIWIFSKKFHCDSLIVSSILKTIKIWKHEFVMTKEVKYRIIIKSNTLI